MFDEDPTGELTKAALAPIVAAIKRASRILSILIPIGLILVAVTLVLIFKH